MRIVVDGKHWTLRFAKVSGGDLGVCTTPNKPGKTITIDPKVTRPGKDLVFMETVLHETLHAACWNLDEEYVEAYAHSAARALHRLGFRLDDPHPEIPGR